MSEEIWKTIPEFSNYLISNFGNIFNTKYDMLMQVSENNFGHLKITLVSEWDGKRYTRSVAQLVAEAFVSPPNALCDQVVVLDGDFSNVVSYNLVWRPRWFAWKYTRQLKEPQPIRYQNLRVIELTTGREYNSIIEAGMAHGLLFDDVWRSTYTRAYIFPDGCTFEVIGAIEINRV